MLPAYVRQCVREHHTAWSCLTSHTSTGISWWTSAVCFLPPPFQTTRYLCSFPGFHSFFPHSLVANESATYFLEKMATSTRELHRLAVTSYLPASFPCPPPFPSTGELQGYLFRAPITAFLTYSSSSSSSLCPSSSIGSCKWVIHIKSIILLSVLPS